MALESAQSGEEDQFGGGKLVVEQSLGAVESTGDAVAAVSANRVLQVLAGDTDAVNADVTGVLQMPVAADGTVVYTSSQAVALPNADTGFELTPSVDAPAAAGSGTDGAAEALTTDKVRAMLVKYLAQAGYLTGEQIAPAQDAVAVLASAATADDILRAALSTAYPNNPSFVPHIARLFMAHYSAARKREPHANGKLELQPLRFNGYRPITRLGGGGFGEVWGVKLIEDGGVLGGDEEGIKVFKRMIKPVKPGTKEWEPIDSSASAAAELERFAREVRAYKALKGIHGIPQYDASGTYTDTSTGQTYPYLTMSYHPGYPLDALMAAPKGKTSREQWIDICTLIAITLEQIHDLEWVHRDLKPSNVLLADTGEVKVFDLGLGREHGEHAHAHDVTHTGTIIGTPDYMPPEQSQGQGHHVGPSADLYSLGCMLHEALSGEPPFGRAKDLNIIKVVGGHAEREPDLTWMDALPAKYQVLKPVLKRLLLKKPSERGTAAQLGEELYAVSDLKKRNAKLDFKAFAAKPELHRIHISPELLPPEFEQDVAIPSRHYSPHVVGTNGSAKIVDEGPAKFTEALRASTYPEEVQEATRAGIRNILLWTAGGVVVVGGLIGTTVAFIINGANRDAVPQPPVQPDFSPPAIVAPEHVGPKVLPGEFVILPKKSGKIEKMSLLSKLPIQLELTDKEATLMGNNGQTRNAFIQLTPQQLCMLLGVKTENELPESLRKNVKIGVGFALSNEKGEWIMFTNYVGFVVGTPSKKGPGHAQDITVYSDLPGIRDKFAEHSLGSQPYGNMFDDPVVNALIRDQALEQTTVTNADLPGIDAESRQGNLESFLGAVRTFRDMLQKERPAGPLPKNK